MANLYYTAHNRKGKKRGEKKKQKPSVRCTAKYLIDIRKFARRDAPARGSVRRSARAATGYIIGRHESRLDVIPSRRNRERNDFRPETSSDLFNMGARRRSAHVRRGGELDGKSSGFHGRSPSAVPPRPIRIGLGIPSRKTSPRGVRPRTDLCFPRRDIFAGARRRRSVGRFAVLESRGRRMSFYQTPHWKTLRPPAERLVLQDSVLARDSTTTWIIVIEYGSVLRITWQPITSKIWVLLTLTENQRSLDGGFV